MFRLISSVLVFLLIFGSATAQAANIVLSVSDGANEGFNDNSAPFANQTGNTGTTLGEQRLQVFQAAADYWEERLVLTVDVVVDIKFDPLDCNAFGAVLGSAGPRSLFRDFANAPQPNVFYVGAVANNLAGVRLGTSSIDIGATFNSSIDRNDNCLVGTDWWLGIDSPAPGGTISLFDTVLHEIGHGLGVVAVINSSGSDLNSFIDAYTFHLYDETQGRFWRDMTNAQRASSVVNNTKVSFRGTNVESNTNHVQAGRSNDGHLRIYAPNPHEPGSSISHWDTALSPDELMEPSATPTSDDRATLQMLKDIGWRLTQDLPGTIGFVSASTIGNENQGTVSVQLERTQGSVGAVSVQVSTSDGSATAGQDYTAINNQLVSWADGESGVRTVTVSLINDTAVENNETVNLSITNVTGGASTELTQSTLTIISDDIPPAGSIGFVSSTISVNETDNSVAIQMRRDDGSSGAVSVRLDSANGSATAGQDYTAISNRLVSWADGEAGIKTVNLTIIDDALIENDETVNLSLSNVIGGATLSTSTATVTISSEDVAMPGSIGFVTTAVTQNEGAGTAEFSLQRTGGSNGAISVRVRSRGDTAVASEDYVGLLQTVSWADGDTATKSVNVVLIDDDQIESDETTDLLLDNVTGGASLSNSLATLTIQDNDSDPDPQPEDEDSLLDMIIPILAVISSQARKEALD